MAGLVPTRTTRWTPAMIAGVGAVVGVVALVVLAIAGVFSGSSNVGTVSAGAAPSTSTGSSASSAAQQYPFGAPSARADYSVPMPPGQSTLVPTVGTKTTQRLYGADPFQEAVSVTQHVWPAALPESAPNNNVPDRPRAVTLLTPADPITAITSVPLLHFPNDAPILYVNKNGVPKVTENEIKRLGGTGIARYHNVQALLVGAADNSGGEKQLNAMGLKYATVTAPNTAALANTVDKLYGSIQNPDTGVPIMDNGTQSVMIGSRQSYTYLLPATHWVAHMPAGLLWVDSNSVPQATIDALKRRNGQARIYLFGGPQQISGNIASKLAQYGAVIRVTNDDNVAYNAPPTDTPEETAIAFSKMWDSAGEMGWKITGPGHGFTLVNLNDWAGAVASSPLSHLGFHAPLLFTDSATTLPSDVDAYFKSVEPTFLNTPADGPYNMTYAIGSWDQISWPEELQVEYDSGGGNRRRHRL